MLNETAVGCTVDGLTQDLGFQGPGSRWNRRTTVKPRKTTLACAFMKPFVYSFGISVLLCAALIPQAPAAQVGPEGYTNSFDTRPAAADWATRSYAGSAGEVYALTNMVELLSASAFGQSLVDGSPADPPLTNNLAVWTSGGGGYLCTRPATSRSTMLLAKLSNNTGTNATKVRIVYDLGIKAPMPEPEYPGLYVFYNIGGQANKWVPIPELSSPTPTTGTLVADLTFTNTWAPGTNFFILWVDDNADMAGDDPAYTLDNIYVGVTAGMPYRPPLSVGLSTPTNNTTFFAPSVISLVATTSVSLYVTNVAFYADGVKLGDAASSPYTLDWSNPPVGQHTLTAVATDDQGTRTSSAGVNILVFDAIGSPLARITSPTNGFTAQGPTNVTVLATVSAANPVTNVEFWVNGAVVTNDTASPYGFSWSAPFGNLALTAIASDTNGLRGTSAVVNIVITTPPTNTVAPTLVAHTPDAGVTLSNLSTVQVTFSETVVNVDASDLLLNGVAATSVSGSGSNYTFTVEAPASGLVTVTWAANHGITDVGWPSALPFDAAAPGATWTFNFINLNPQAAVVGPEGYLNSFATQPPATDWATSSANGGAADNYDMDADINANITASGITTRVPADAANPPAKMTTAVWSSTGLYLQLRPTGNRYTVLLGKFLNNTGTNATQVGLSYVFTIAAGGVAEDAGKGTRVYYSLSGLPNSWVNLPTFNSTASANGSSTLSTNLALNWTNGANLYLLWADDNANAFGDDSANQIDDFSLKVTAGAPPYFASTVTAPAPNALLVSSEPVTARATAVNGTAPYTVQYFTNRAAGNTIFAAAGSSTNAPYEVNLGTLPAGTYNLYSVATDSAATPVSTNSLTNTFFVADPIALTLTAPATGATFDNATSVSGRATVAGGTPPYSVQFSLDGVPNGSPITAPPYERDFGPLFVGDHTVAATVTDAGGWTSNSAVATVHITGPLGVLLTPTNGASMNFGQEVGLTAAPGGGMGPYRVTFYLNDQALGTSTAAPFATNLGILPAGSYTSYVHVTDASVPPQQANSTTSIFTILPNPILVSVTSPTNGQSVTANQALALAATASVDAPLTISTVQFYLNSTSAGVDDTAPYTGSAIPAEGTYVVYAVATDNLGRRSYSATNQITASLPPGGNNNFANAFTLIGPIVTATGNNSTANKEFREPNHANNWGGASLWWTWTPTASGPTTIDTMGSDFNTLLAVYTGTSVNGLAPVAANDDYSGNPWSRLEFNAVAGTVYRIVVDGYAAFRFPPQPERGNIVLHIKGVGGLNLVTPTNGMVFTFGDPIPVTATTDNNFPNPPAARVDFYRNGTLFASTTSEPFSTVATNVPAGTNSFYVIATDSLGQPVQSAVVSVFVQTIGVTLLSPADDTMFLNANPIAVTAWTYLPSGTITNVAFFVDGVKFGEDDTVPFSATWSNVVGGSHRLTAIGRSDTGVSYNSQPVNIGVASTLLPYGAVWKYLDNGSDQGTAWIAPNFDDSSWASGPAPLGYGDSNGRLTATTNSFGPDPNNKYVTTYYRQAFVLSNAASFSAITLNIERDDGAIVYLNGTELARFNMPTGAISYTNWASANANDDGGTVFSINVSPTRFVDGANVLAVEIHQDAGNSSDIWFQMQLVGLPVIIHNLMPTVALISPPDGTFDLSPGSFTLNAEAADADGAVTKVEFFANGTKLGELANAPYTLAWDHVPAGIYALVAVATDNQEGTQATDPVTVTVYDPLSRWIAFNDHYAGPGTHPNATAWNPFGTEGGAPGDEGPLHNVQTGAALPAYLTVMEFGAFADTACGAPVPGTPAYATFNGYVDFGSGDRNHAILVTESSEVFHLFTGLNPLRRYSFRGTVVGGEANYSNRWTRFTLVGASAFTPAHTANVLTAAIQPALAPEEAAMNTGDNRSGDMVGWDNIVPGPDGAFLIVSSQYTGPAPGNEHPGPMAYAPVAVRLEEIGATPFVALTEPLDGSTVVGPTNITMAAEASALGGVANVLFLANGAVVGSATVPPYTTDWTNPDFATYLLEAVAIDTQGIASTSAPVTLHLVTPPTNTIAPYIASQAPAGGSTVTNLTSVQVLFSQTVVGVDAADLLINGVPATNVVGGGSNYVFSFVQPPYGTVQFAWAPNAAIHDLSWPDNLPFYDNNPDNYWTYELIDRTPPTVIAKSPAAGATLTNLTEITVTFSEPVAGLDAGDLLVNGTPAYDMDGTGATYNFSFSQPASGTVTITWAANHGIVDLAPAQNPFSATNAGATWTYTLDAKTILIQSNNFWLLVKGTNEASIPTNAWRQIGFDDSGWSNAPAPFFYGDPYSNGVPAYTLLSDMRSNYSTIYLRKAFVVPNAGGITNLILRAQIDDGMIVWINGVEVLRTNAPAGEVPYNGTAPATAQEPQNNGAAYVNYTLLDPRGYLVSGTNVIAVHALNESLTTSSDFGFNAQLYTYQTDTEAVAPRVVGKDPEAGYVLGLTNLTVTFSEPVTNVDAADLLINGVPATAVSSSTNTIYSFTFPQPAFGAVSISWAADHGIVDLDIDPKPFNAGLSSSTWGYVLLNANSPYLTLITPAANTPVTALTEIALTFSEPVSGVDAGDLLLNGMPATGLSGSGTTYTFTFPQPAYGTVNITWAANHGIQDFNQPPEPFDPLWPAHTWTYTLVDQIPPRIVAVDPAPGAQVLNLTQLTVTFSEAVSGVGAADLLLNGVAAGSVTGSNATYTFTFTQPNAALINVTWAANHGIRDLATVPNAFDATAPGATWAYPTVDNVRPTLLSVSPGPGATVRSLNRISLSFDEPVQGVEAASLAINGVPAEQVSGAGAGPYTFGFTPPATGVVQIALSPMIMDLAASPNDYAGSNWTYVLNPNLPLPTISRGPYLQLQTPTSIIVRWRTATATDSSVQYGLDPESRTNTVNDATVTTEHIVQLANLTPDTRYVYAIGTTDGGLVVNTNYYFSTAPPVGTSRPTRIWFISDYGFKDSGEASVRDSYFNYVAPVKPADVWITGGDNDQTDGTDAHDQDAIFGTTYGYGNLIRNVPLRPTIGNHDAMTSSGGPYYANFSMPTNGEAGGVPSGTEHYYSFDYNNIHFISLDSIVGNLSSSTNTAMAQWLRQDLATTTQKWIIAYWHGAPYTKGSHDSDSTTDTLAWMVQMRQNIVPILESYGVDLVLNGHSHVYERTWLLQGHYGFSTTFSETNKVDGGDGRVDGSGAYLKSLRSAGTIYVTAAVGGQLQNHMSVQHPAHLLKISDSLGSLVIDVNGDRLDFQFLNTSGTALDHFTISKEAQSMPDVPTGLTATEIAAGQVRLTWNNTPNNEMGFVLERSTDGRTFTQLAAIGANLTSYTDTTLPAGASAYYRIRAWNAAGGSAPSELALFGVALVSLTITQLPTGDLVVSWPVSATGYELQGSTTLGLTADWQPVTESVFTMDELNVCPIPMTPDQPPLRFFRLLKR